MNIMRNIYVLVTVIMFSAAGPSWSQPLTFSGLSSNSTRIDVLKAFPAAHKKNDCRSGDTVLRTADGITSCDELEFDRYALDNNIFNLSFQFNTDGTLRYITLLELFDPVVTNEIEVSNFRMRIGSIYNSLAELISSKYGPAVLNSPHSYFPANGGDQDREWQPGRGTNWQVGGDRIELLSDGTDRKVGKRQLPASVMIFYTFARRDEFNKF